MTWHMPQPYVCIYAAFTRDFLYMGSSQRKMYPSIQVASTQQTAANVLLWSVKLDF